MKLTKEQVKHIADLARLKVEENKLDYYTDELSRVLDYVEQLNTVNTEKISPKIQASSLSNSAREDEQRTIPEEERSNMVKRLMKAVPFSKDGFIKVKSILNKK